MRASIASCVGAAVWVAGCGGTLDAGRDRPGSLLPVDERNPLIIDKFVVAVQRSSPDTSVAFDDMQGPPLRPDDAGNAGVVTKIDAPLAATNLWEMLTDPRTFGS